MSQRKRRPTETGEFRRVRRFQDLMRHRVQHILLVSSLYDSFTLTEDGHLNEALMRQFVDLNLTHNPDLIRVPSGAEALEMARADNRFDLIIATIHIGDVHAAELAARLRDAGADIPVVLLAFNNRDLTDYLARHDTAALERIFLWQGDVRILLAITKFVEDRRNVDRDTGELGVPAIIVVEDNIRFYSSFLPVIYTELVHHTHGLISEGLNLGQKLLRMRARPKVLLCQNYEEAWDYFTRFEEQILGIISDIEFPWHGRLYRQAGVELASRVRRVRYDIPIVLQSSIPDNEELARRLNAAFLLKGSPVMLHQLRSILVDAFGFGDFVFRNREGAEVARARDLRELIEQLRTVPAESLALHGERNHFSMWLKARTEFSVAEKLRPRKVSEFESLEHLRQDLIQSISEYRLDRDRMVVADFNGQTYDPTINVTRIGGGSLGGKARGLAFVNRLLRESGIQRRFPDVEVGVPSAVVLATDVFDEFIEKNDLRDMAIESGSDREIESRFLGAPFPEQAMHDLGIYLAQTQFPLAVRSSGLLEDSPSQPFAGVYSTFMVPNQDPDPQKRLVELIAAIKRVYASTFSRQSKKFVQMTPYRLEEEKMAVIIQQTVGRRHGDRFYPDFSGVARSYNFYPTPPLASEDGIVAVALGLGRTVVEGSTCLRFCPRYPRHLVAFSSVHDVLDNSQREFYALDLSRPVAIEGGEGAELTAYALDVAERDGTLTAVGSTYSPENDVIYDGTSRSGVRLVSFAPVLKHQVFPLAELLDELLEIGTRGTSLPVEIEFAANLHDETRQRPFFGFLQMRPLALSGEFEDVRIGHVPSSELICRSTSVLGNGKLETIRDLLVVDFNRFERSRSVEVAHLVARFNSRLQDEGLPYVLIGVGRWGSTDPHLGIPVGWSQIAGARVIIESGFRDFRVTPSQGTHFFQNLTSCNVGYFTVNPQAGDGYIDWDWLGTTPALEEEGCVRWIRLEQPVIVKMSGRTGEGVVLKPSKRGAGTEGAP